VGYFSGSAPICKHKNGGDDNLSQPPYDGSNATYKVQFMSKKGQRQKDLTATFLAGGLDEDRLDARHQFTQRSKDHQKNKTHKTALARAAEVELSGDIDLLPAGRVIQVHSIYCDVEIDSQLWLCVVRKTVHQVSATRVVVGDMVRVSVVGESTQPREGIIERIEPRKSIITRADVRQEKDKIVGQIPIITNADQMLIVASLVLPRIKWGLIDRMIVAARAGDVEPIVCLNKIDLLETADQRVAKPELDDALAEADEVLSYYGKLGIKSLRTSVVSGTGIDALRDRLTDKLTALAGHSGVGKSSLIRAVQPTLNIKVGEISNYNNKGRHTTTSARIYTLDGGGRVVDTPGVRLFGLWNVSPDTLLSYFPDVADDTAPDWRRESFERMLVSLR
jgi:ribosome biogenesis GTPase